MTETASPLAQRVGERLANWYSEFRTRLEEENALLNLDAESRRQLAEDCSVSADTLLQIVRAGPNGAAEMEKLMKALHLDSAELQTHSPDVYREMQINCATCRDKGRCRHDLENHTAPVTFSEYCVNTAILNRLQAETPLMEE
ncbi:DUF6455 family protein [Rhizobium oryzicola]|uniref:DUF6455 family protein n=1 Tax=Rhizobium oryzicola TaxID=1232668 RepID=A0ABT8STZ4_9HYPH|nr:DUF6455 family protein [Rhizobium oryzicola]MDO1581806.1 DUF6455 family protein [Rhizobium oryzicola]